MSQQYHPPILRRPEDVVVDVQGFVTQVDDEDNPVKFATVIQVLPHTAGRSLRQEEGGDDDDPVARDAQQQQLPSKDVTSPLYPSAAAYARQYGFYTRKSENE